MVAPSSDSTSLKEYLKKYESGYEEEKKKKKKKKKAKTDISGVIIVDEDPVWQKPVTIDEEEDDSADEEKPLVDEDIDVKRMKRLEELRAKRPFGAISEDGSGWVSVSDAPKNLNSDVQNLDLSPLRKGIARNDSPSPEPKLNPSSTVDVDISPPRKRRARYDTPSPEPQDNDLSPPRKRSARSDTLSGKVDDDMSPPRRRQKHRNSPPHEVDLQASPNAHDLDLSPPRKSRHRSPVIEQRQKTGLVTGKDVKDEIAKTKKEEWMRFKELDAAVSGRGAEPVYRDKVTGERLSKEEYLQSQKKKEKEKPKEIKLEWGKGLAQKREMEARLQELESEKEKPFARSRDDPELDNMLKDRLRWGDPMAHLVKKKRAEQVLPDLGADDKMKESGFIIPQEIPPHSWIRRGLDAAPNRYGIKPGRHWDGVDRSNGYEKQMFKRTNEKQATEREAYLWSVADM
ncbi:BUD13 homolog isoform X2 [Ipomoea triloba]|uniref:BUD13 homolog isoform X2 n=1 Tax=Ipomoea triloba TaxID=35885 RepID=UPI00125E7641|nr:BUD13 homolog isoform X2 [Ipomoea triloba]